MEEWANQWLVTLSPSKSCDMTPALRGSPESHNLFFFDEPISHIKHHKHLGIVIQQNLKWGTGIEYSDIVFDNCTKEEQAHIEFVHKISGRIISGAIREMSSNVIFTGLGWENMQHRLQQHKCLFYHDIINGNAPQYLIDDLPRHVWDQTRYNLRNKDDNNLYN